MDLLPADRKSQTESILRLAALGTLLTTSVLAPNTVSLFASFMPSEDKKKTLRAIRYAKDTGWITFRESSKGLEVALTAKGRLKWQRIELTRPLHESKWDKRWRFVIFDIPVGLKPNAFAFRADLKKLGLKQLQRSIWITPYSCQTQIALLRQIYDIKLYVRIMEVIAIDNEAELKTLFHLK